MNTVARLEAMMQKLQEQETTLSTLTKDCNLNLPPEDVATALDEQYRRHKDTLPLELAAAMLRASLWLQKRCIERELAEARAMALIEQMRTPGARH